jgi:hypothetical protein
MLKVLVVLLLAVAFCYAQSEIKLTIDPFTVDTPPLVIVIENPAALPVSSERSVPGGNILGGERDLLLTVEDGSAGLLLSTGVSNGAWNMGTPNSASGFALLQYDGVDGSSALNRNGLNIDLTANGATAFRAVIESDVETSYVFRIFSGNSESTFTQSIPGTPQGAGSQEYFFNFSSFNGNADFSNVGAIELQVNAFDNVDSFISFFGTHGPVVSPSGTPQPQPSRSPSPSGVPEWYTFDDDDNGVSPCSTNEKRRTYFLTESNIIYYYFYGFNDPYENQYSSASPASTLGLSVVLALFSFAILF